MIEDKIFGPFTMKQFISLAIGFGLSYVAYKQLPVPASYVSVALIMIASCAAAFVRFNQKHIPVQDLRQYFLELKATTPPEAYQKMLERKLAEIYSHMQIRESRGLPPDPKFEEVKTILESLNRE